MAGDLPLPVLYRDLTPLSSNDHGSWRARPLTSLGFMKGVHALPLTVDEFIDAQRHYPIIFASGDDPVPLALMGLNEGVNVFVSDSGDLTSDIYIPAYVRRYPYMLARMRPESEELTLCFDPTAGALGADVDGFALFEGAEPSDQTKELLGFCETFEVAGQKTMAFVKELRQHNLLMEGEVTIQPEGAAQPFIYRGFQMIDEQKLHDLRGDVLRKFNQSGILALIYAHLYSLRLINQIFVRQNSPMPPAGDSADVSGLVANTPA